MKRLSRQTTTSYVALNPQWTDLCHILHFCVYGAFLVLCHCGRCDSVLKVKPFFELFLKIIPDCISDQPLS